LLIKKVFWVFEKWSKREVERKDNWDYNNFFLITWDVTIRTCIAHEREESEMLVRQCQGKIPLGRLKCRWIILWFWEKYVVKDGLSSTVLGEGPMLSFSEDVNEPLGSWKSSLWPFCGPDHWNMSLLQCCEVITH
jgi:hypothetical protein